MVQKLKLLLLLSSCFFLSVNGYCVDYCDDANAEVCYEMASDENPLSDTTSNSNTAALKGAGEPNYTTDAPAGYVAGSYDWDDANDYTTTSDFLGSLNNVSFVAWVYYDTDTTDDYLVHYDANADGFLILRDNVGAASRTDCFTTILANGSETYRVETATNSATSGSWIHYAFTFGSTTLKVYVNGVEDANSPDTGSFGMGDPTTSMYLGNNSTGASNIVADGHMTRIAVFSRTLNITEINDIIDHDLDGSVGAPPAARRIFMVN